MNRKFAGSTVCVLFTILVLTAPFAMAHPLFNSRQHYYHQAYGTASGDLDGDGWLDLMVGPENSVLRGNGDGTFQFIKNEIVESGGYSEVAIALADFDLDGILDSVVAASTFNPSSRGLWLFLGNGDATFQAPDRYDTTTWPQEIATGDLNDDGWPDIVAANPWSGSITVLLGMGGGVFQAPVDHLTGGSPRSPVIGELNGDGLLDLVMKNESDVLMYPGNGDGSFQEPVSFNLANSPDFVTTGDLDGDTILDLVMVDYENPFVSVMMGNGDGTFVEQTYPVGRGGQTATLFDIDGDGRLDIAVTGVTYEGNECIAVMLANGDGTYRRRWDRVSDEAHSVTYGHFNADGFLDMAVDRDSTGGYIVYLGDAESTFTDAGHLPSGNGPSGIALDDLDGDQVPDLITAHKYDDNISIMLGNGDGTFQPPTLYWMGFGPEIVVIADFDGDGNRDVAAGGWRSSSSERGYVTVRFGNGDGTLKQAAYYLDGLKIFDLAVGDLDGDGAPDLVAGHQLNDIAGRRVAVLLNNGDGTFRSGPNLGNYPYGEVHVDVGDLDQDGLSDVVAVSYGDDDIYEHGEIDLFLGYGDGTFQSPISLDLGHWYYSDVAVGDLNGDSIPELVLDFNRDHTVVLFGNPPLTYTDQDYHDTFINTSVFLFDLDGDGSLDVAHSSRKCASVLLNNGDGTLQPAIGYGIDGDAVALAIDDLNGDGLPDLVTANHDADTISLLFGRGNDGTVSADLTCLPAAGTLPFPSKFTVSITNNYQGQTRRMYYQVDVTLASEQHFSNWRRGWQNVLAGEIHSMNWWQTIPDLGSLAGVSNFLLSTADITPAPYNLPPYPPAGDSDTDRCTITGAMP